jgi:hypothetical protein
MSGTPDPAPGADPRLALVSRLHAASDWAAAARAEATKHLDSVRVFVSYDEGGGCSRELREIALGIVLDLTKIDGDLRRLDDGAVRALYAVLAEARTYFIDTRTGDGAKP